MLKMKVDPEMYMKTKGRATKCPIKYRTLVPGWSEFCSKKRLASTQNRPSDRNRYHLAIDSGLGAGAVPNARSKRTHGELAGLFGLEDEGARRQPSLEQTL